MRSVLSVFGSEWTRRLRSTDRYVRTMYTFTTISWVGGMVYGLYYGIFLYRSTFSLSVLALDGLFGGVGTWLGYVIGVAMVRRWGYGATIKTALVLWAAIAFGTALIAQHIAEWFILLAVLKTIPAGLYTATCDTIMLREMKTRTRGKFLQAILAIEFLVSVIMPSAVGALVGLSYGYRLAFIIAGVIYALGLLVRIALPKPQLSFSVRQMLTIFRRPLYRRHAANRTAAAGFNQLNAFVLTIIPFLMLKDELKMGLLTSACALTAGLVSLMMRRTKPKQHLRLGYSAYVIRSISSLLFVMIWTAPVLYMWQLISKLITPMHDPLQQGLDIHNDSLIMGESVQQNALHINVLNNTLLFVGTTVAYGGFYCLTHTAMGQERAILQTLILSYAAWRFINLAVSARINSLARPPKPYVEQLAENVPLWYTLELVVRSRVTYIRRLMPMA